jgi:hypothetical protein
MAVAGLAIVELNNKFGMIDKNNNMIVSFEYDDIKPYYIGDKAYIIIIKDILCGLIDYYGKLLIDCVHKNTDIENVILFYFKQQEKINKIDIILENEKL